MLVMTRTLTCTPGLFSAAPKDPRGRERETERQRDRQREGGREGEREREREISKEWSICWEPSFKLLRLGKSLPELI